MATEPVTSPRNPLGKVIYAFGLGVLTVLLRLVGSMPEGVATSILFMCLFTPLLDRFTAKFRANKANWKSILTLIVVLATIFGIGVYTIVKVKNLNKKVESTTPPVVQTEEYKFSSAKQDPFNLETINVVVKKGKQSYNAVFKLANKKVTYVSGLDTTDESILTALSKDVLKSLNAKGYIISDNGSEILAAISGNGGLMNIKFTYKDNAITSFKVDENHGESIDGSHYDDYQAVIDALNKLPEDLIAAGKDFAGVENIAGATVTSKAVKAIYKLVYEHINIIESDNGSELIIVGKGFNGDIKGKITYDENLKITGFEILENDESYDEVSEVKDAIDNLPGSFVTAGGDGSKVQNVSGASYTSNGIRYIYETAYKYLQKKTLITEVSEGELRVASKNGKNGLIVATITYNEEKQITSYKIVEHLEDDDYLGEVADAINTLPGKLVEAGADYATVENIAGASITSNAVKEIYAAAYNYLTGGNE